MVDILHERETKGAKETDLFISSGIDEYSQAIARWSIDPTPDTVLRLHEALAKEDFERELAEALSGVKVVDSHFENLDPASNEGLADLAALTVAKAKAAEGEVGKDGKDKLKRFKDKVLNVAGSALAKTGGKKGLTSASGLLLIATACSPQIAKTEMIPPTEPVATEPTPTPTEIPTATPEPTPGPYGVEGGPAHAIEDPKTYELKELVSDEDWKLIVENSSVKTMQDGSKLLSFMLPWGCQSEDDGSFSQKFVEQARELHPDVHDVEVAAICNLNPDLPNYGTVTEEDYKKFSLDKLVDELGDLGEASNLTQEKIRELAERLECQGPEGTCVYRTFWMEGGVQDGTVEVISSGMIQTIDLKDSNNDIIAEAEVATCVTRDLQGESQLLQIVTQVRPASNPDINIYTWTNSFAGNYEDPENSEPYSIEELEEIFREGREFIFVFSTEDYERGLSYTEVMSKLYSRAGYKETLQAFVDGKDDIESTEPILIMPVSFLADY